MNQRITRLARGLAAAGTLFLATTAAGAFQLTDTNYTVLKPAQPTATEVGPGRVEIAEVFWYAMTSPEKSSGSMPACCVC